MKTYYVAEGSVCGSCGHKHRTLSGAERCANGYHAAIRRAYPSTFPTRAYSDRCIVKYVDGERVDLSDRELEELDSMRQTCTK
jgi:hypothetical protein